MGAPRTVVREFHNERVLSVERLPGRCIVVTSKVDRHSKPETILTFSIDEGGFHIAVETEVDDADRVATWWLDDEMLQMLDIKPLEVIEEPEPQANLDCATNGEILLEMQRRINNGRWPFDATKDTIDVDYRPADD